MMGMIALYKLNDDQTWNGGLRGLMKSLNSLEPLGLQFEPTTRGRPSYVHRCRHIPCNWLEDVLGEVKRCEELEIFLELKDFPSRNLS